MQYEARSSVPPALPQITGVANVWPTCLDAAYVRIMFQLSSLSLNCGIVLTGKAVTHSIICLQAEGWQPTGSRAGCVSLSAEGGTATIEASWLPTIAGTLPVPEIHLRDVSHQEVFDAGSSTEFINVLPLQ